MSGRRNRAIGTGRCGRKPDPVCRKFCTFAPSCFPTSTYTHHPTGQAIELRTAGIHPWKPGSSTSPRRSKRSSGGCRPSAKRGSIGFADPRRSCSSGHSGPSWSWPAKHRLPVVLHCVKAFEPLMRELAAVPLRAVIFHGFIGSRQQAAEALKRGYCLSYGAARSPRRAASRRCAPPPPTGFSSRPTTRRPPIEEVYARAAELREESVERLQRCTLANYERIFGEPLSDESTFIEKWKTGWNEPSCCSAREKLQPPPAGACPRRAGRRRAYAAEMIARAGVGRMTWPMPTW